jgi:hypothetical protein
MIIFVITQVISVILEPFLKVEPYIRRKFLEEQMRMFQSHFFVISGEKTLFLAKIKKSLPIFFLDFEGELR